MNARSATRILTLLIAGYETTASTLVWVLGVVASEPCIQAELQAEIDAKGVVEAPLAFRDTHPLTYRTVLEVIRLYTAIPMSSRRTSSPDVLSGFEVPARTNVVVPVWVLHRDPALWVRPTDVVPARFEGCPAHRLSHYVPFSKGERSCVGQGFAMAEVAMVVTRVLARLSLSLTSASLPRPVSLVSLQPEGGLSLRLRRRDA